MNNPIPAATQRTYTVMDLSGNRQREESALEVRDRFDRDGVIVLPNFLAESELVPLRRELARHFTSLSPEMLGTHFGAREETKKYACDVVSWDPVAKGNREFQQLAAQPRLAEITEAALGAGCTAAGSLVMFSVGGGRGQAWHQDCPPGENQGFNLNRLFYTEDITREDGAIVFVPGAHRRGRIPRGGHQAYIEGEVLLTPKAGTLVLLHGHVFHRVTPNLNMKPRVSVNFRAFPAGVSPDVTCVGVYRNGTVKFCDQAKQHDGTPVDTDLTVTGR
jgi:ectoine hydroxylase-related dioxygenase (phytanoyl-CoA dioxygenase family)